MELEVVLQPGQRMQKVKCCRKHDETVGIETLMSSVAPWIWSKMIAWHRHRGRDPDGKAPGEWG
jgi:hypothetical protein